MTGTQRKPQPRDSAGRPIHPNSLQADPANMRRITDGRKEFNQDQKAMETWASQDFGAAIQPAYGDDE